MAQLLLYLCIVFAAVAYQDSVQVMNLVIAELRVGLTVHEKLQRLRTIITVRASLVGDEACRVESHTYRFEEKVQINSREVFVNYRAITVVQMQERREGVVGVGHVLRLRKVERVAINQYEKVGVLVNLLRNLVLLPWKNASR